jgi:hypothetical protein
MGELIERVKLNLLVYGNGIEDNFRNNSLHFLEKYSKSDDIVKSIEIARIEPGTFYFLHYLDNSDWMRYSPIFVVDYKKFGNQTIIFAINFNFIPLEIRPLIFDEYLLVENFEEDIPIEVEYDKVYKVLFKLGFEYALMEYNAIQIKMVHRIHIEATPRWLYSQHPKAVYDPDKLMQIWNKKLETKAQRDKEMTTAILKDFYDTQTEISEKYKVLKDHIKRLQSSAKKYGGKR